jgi:hypothetical protein
MNSNTCSRICSLFQIKPTPEHTRDRVTLEYVIQLNNDSLMSPENGFQVFHQDYPAPIPSKDGAGLFGALFGVSFSNPKYSPDNSEPKTCIQAIAMTEYVEAFGYGGRQPHASPHPTNLRCSSPTSNDASEYYGCHHPSNSSETVSQYESTN